MDLRSAGDGTSGCLASKLISRRRNGAGEFKPLVLVDCAELFVELNGGEVPIEDGPFEAGAAAEAGDFGGFLEEAFADGLAAGGFADEEVLDIEGGLGG